MAPAGPIRDRSAILGYYEDGPNLVTMAMNGWGAPEPAWWLNLQARPNAHVELKNGTRVVRARAAVGEERERLWARFREFGDDPDDYAHRRPGRTEVVVLEPAAVAGALPSLSRSETTRSGSADWDPA